MIVKQDEKWIPLPDQLDGIARIYNEDFVSRYLISVYHSTLILTYNDMLPMNLVQLIVMSFLMILSAIINANILGNVAVLASALSKKTTDFQDKFDTVNTVMKNIQLPEVEQGVIREFIMTSHNFLGAQQEMQSFLNTISPSLKIEVTRHIFSIMSAKSLIFKNTSEINDYLSR